MAKQPEKKPGEQKPLGRVVNARCLVRRPGGLVAELVVTVSIEPDGEGQVLDWRIGQEDVRAIVMSKAQRNLAEVHEWSTP